MPQDAKHRRSWFDALAADHKFDPLVAHFWYQLSEKLSDIQVDSFLNIYDHIFYLYIYSNLKSYISQKGIQQYLRYYSGSLYNALVHLYPEMNLDRNKFKAKGIFLSSSLLYITYHLLLFLSIFLFFNYRTLLGR